MSTCAGCFWRIEPTDLDRKLWAKFSSHPMPVACWPKFAKEGDPRRVERTDDASPVCQHGQSAGTQPATKPSRHQEKLL